jgi:hypothetical protein
VPSLPSTKSISYRMEELREELNKLREEVAELRLLQVAKTTQGKKKDPCQGVTGKGTPCRNGALPGTCHCRMHSREPKESREPKQKKEPKPKKIQPEHTHGIGEEPTEPCALCETHGNVLDPTLPDVGFRETDDVTERLRALLQSE